MKSPKPRQELIWIAMFSFGTWLLTTFAMMILYITKGGLAVPTTATVSPQVYQTAVDFSEVLIFQVIPGLTFGYLLLGLFILRVRAKVIQDGNHDA